MNKSPIRSRNKSHPSLLVRSSRWAAGMLAFLLVAALIAWGTTRIIPPPGNPRLTLSHPATPETIKRGAYLARVGDCVACHTRSGAPPFSGGDPIASPIGGMVPPNITPDKQFGIGNYSLGDFDRAVRYGIAPSGDTLYPAMPWMSYSRITRDDMTALYAYFMSDVTPVAAPAAENSIPWPLSLRWPMTLWRWFIAPNPQAPEAALPHDPVSLGAYYVNGLGHCGACHTPRALTLQETAFDNSSGTAYLSGGQVIDGYTVPSLRGEQRTGLGNTSEEEIVELLKTGRTDKTATFGPMSDVVSHSTQYMTGHDLRAMATYLRSLKPHLAQDKPYYDLSTLTGITNGDLSRPGETEYLSQCSGCHLANGLGYRKKFPALALNTQVNNPDPSGLIQIVLHGATHADTQAHQPLYSMPAYENKLSDRNIADILSFIRSSWGNQAPAVSASQVAESR